MADEIKTCVYCGKDVAGRCVGVNNGVACPLCYYENSPPELATRLCNIAGLPLAGLVEKHGSPETVQAILDEYNKNEREYHQRRLELERKYAADDAAKLRKEESHV